MSLARVGDAWRSRPPWLDRAVSVAGLVLLWQVLAMTVFASTRVVPTPVEVASQLWDDRESYRLNIWTTLRGALVGYFWGNLVAIVLALVVELAPMVEAPVLRLAIACFNIPLVAIAPILVVTLSGDGPKAALAALSVFFTTLIATLLGLRSADRTSLDLVHAYGGSQWMAVHKVKLWAALPSLFAGLRVAAPAALLGALIGEYLGANQGLGAAMIQAQSSFAVARTWGIALVVSALAGVLYLVASGLAHLLTPWAGQSDVGMVGPIVGEFDDGPWKRMARALVLLIVSIAVVIGAWHALVHGFNLNPFFAKDPAAVGAYLVTGPGAAAHRDELFRALWQTLKDASAGYLVGTLAATGVAVLVVLSRTIEQTIMPVAVALRSVPLVAMTPLIALLFGRGLLGVTAVVGIVTFFPTLVNVAVGLRSAPAQACDVVRVSGGNPLMVARKVRLPYALPAFFASARIAAPAAIGGAALAEWLATGKGLGSLLVISYSASDFNTLWSGSALIVAVSVGLYSVVGMIEGWILARMGTIQR
jgi:ABC-type nitrate/sulfonate/bicarbonate transport system permease component